MTHFQEYRCQMIDFYMFVDDSKKHIASSSQHCIEFR